MKQHDSKTEGRGDPLYLALDYVGGMIDELLQFGPTDEDLRKIRARVTKALEEHEAIRSPQSLAEPGRSDMLARQERMADVRAQIAYLEQNNLGGRHIAEIGRLSDELSRLRNEGGGEEAEIDQSEVEFFKELKRGSASPSDLPAREAIERLERSIQFWAEERPGMNAEDNVRRLTKLAEYQAKLIAALQPLSQGNGEAVGWEAEAEFWCRLFGRAVDALDVIAGNEDEDWNPEEFASSTAEALRGEYAKRPIPRTTPPSQPEGVREALDTACKRIQLVRNELTDDEQSLMLKAAIRDIDKAIALTTTPPSRPCRSGGVA